MARLYAAKMPVWMIVASIIAVLVFLLIGFVLGVMYRKKVSEREIASAEDKAKRIIAERKALKPLKTKSARRCSRRRKKSIAPAPSATAK